MTRILSAFNLLKRVGFAILFLGVYENLQAQPPQILWERDGEGDSSRYGREILPLGDQNLDGFDDFAVQAFGVGPQGTDEGVWLDLFHGGNPPSAEPYMRIQTPPDGIWRGDIWTLDFNGDGFTDIMLEGNLKIYFGGPDADTIPDVFWPGQRPENEVSFNTIGDFNGDGNDDIYRYDPPSGGGDSVEIFFGGVPFDTISDISMQSPTGMNGFSLPRTYGDLNGDGIDDFITSTYPFGVGITRLFVFHGSTIPDTLVDQIVDIEGEHVHKDLVPDLNGDGNDDLIVYGQSDGVMVFLGGDTLSPIPTFILGYGSLDGARNYGPEVSGAGDTNGDGFNDLVIVSPNTPGDWGIADHWLGYHWLNPNPVWTVNGGTPPYDLIGIRYAAGLGDVNDDGFDDVALGAFNGNFDGMRGRAVVLAGQARIVPADETSPVFAEEFDLSIAPNPFNSSARLEFDVPFNSREINLRIYNVLGEQVTTTALQPIGGQVEYVFTPDASLASGLYIACAQTGDQFISEKLLFMK